MKAVFRLDLQVVAAGLAAQAMLETLLPGGLPHPVIQPMHGTGDYILINQVFEETQAIRQVDFQLDA